MRRFAFLLALFSSLHLVASHASIWHPSMWGFNVTSSTFDYDNRPVCPLIDLSFSKWWFHNHLDYPPHPDDVFELPAGQNVTLQVACDKGATTYYNSSSGGNIQETDNPNNVCPGSPTSEYHTTGLDDVKGCALAIAYKSNVSDVQPTDFTVFSVNQTCVWSRYTDFGVPERMPPCPDDMCTCAFFWIHSPDSGAEQNYMNGFQCRITDSTSNVGLATSQVPRRCGADPDNGKPDADPGNCTYGAKQPFYWFQAEDNNMFEGAHAPPFYNDLYNFLDGAQDDIFQDSYASIPVPGPNQTALPVLASISTDNTAAPILPITSAPGTTALPSTVSSSLPSSHSSTSVPDTTALPLTASSSLPSSHSSTSVPGTATLPSTTSSSMSSSHSSVPSTTPTVTATLPSTTPSQCVSKRSSFSRRHAPVERGFGSFHAHRAVGRTRHGRSLNLEEKSDIYPL